MINKKELGKFVEAIVIAYKNTSILKKISNLIDYSEEHKTKKFTQIGHRTSIPKEFFEGGDVDNGILAGDFARSIVWGEENFIIDYLKNSAKEGKLNSHKINDFSYRAIDRLISESSTIPTDIFIPIEPEYFDEVHDWLKFGNARYDKNLYILINGKWIKVHWSTKYTPFNNIIFMNKNAIRIIQKKFEEMAPIKSLDTPVYSYSKGEPLRVEFRESNDPDKFDLYIRSVIALEIIDKDSVGVIELPNKKESIKFI